MPQTKFLSSEEEGTGTGMDMGWGREGERVSEIKLQFKNTILSGFSLSSTDKCNTTVTTSGREIVKLEFKNTLLSGFSLSSTDKYNTTVTTILGY